MLRLLVGSVFVMALVLAEDRANEFQIGVDVPQPPKADPNLRPTNLLPKGILQPYKERTFQVQAPTIDRSARAPVHSGRAKRDTGAIAQGIPVFRRQAYDVAPIPPPPPPPIYVPPSHIPARPRPPPSLPRRPTLAKKPAPKRPSYDEPPAYQPVAGSPGAQYPEDHLAPPAPKLKQEQATRYYYPPRFPLPLAKCFHNPTGYVCCNAELNDLMVSTFTDLEARPKFHTCNIQKLANELQDRAQKKFNATFETIASFEDFAQKIQFKGDLVCKVELGGRYMLAYSAVPGVQEKNLPPIADEPKAAGPIPEHHLSRRNTVRMYPKAPVSIRNHNRQNRHKRAVEKP